MNQYDVQQGKSGKWYAYRLYGSYIREEIGGPFKTFESAMVYVNNLIMTQYQWRDGHVPADAAPNRR